MSEMAQIATIITINELERYRGYNLILTRRDSQFHLSYSKQTTKSKLILQHLDTPIFDDDTLTAKTKAKCSLDLNDERAKSKHNQEVVLAEANSHPLLLPVAAAKTSRTCTKRGNKFENR